jgi:hypothetical protein
MNNRKNNQKRQNRNANERPYARNSEDRHNPSRYHQGFDAMQYHDYPHHGNGYNANNEYAADYGRQQNQRNAQFEQNDWKNRQRARFQGEGNRFNNEWQENQPSNRSPYQQHNNYQHNQEQWGNNDHDYTPHPYRDDRDREQYNNNNAWRNNNNNAWQRNGNSAWHNEDRYDHGTERGEYNNRAPHNRSDWQEEQNEDNYYANPYQQQSWDDQDRYNNQQNDRMNRKRNGFGSRNRNY